MTNKIDAAIAALKSQGHSVEPFDRKGEIWYEIDNWMQASPKEMEDLADRVCTLLELEDIFKQREKQERNN
jgi:hypothetical protein